MSNENQTLNVRLLLKAGKVAANLDKAVRAETSKTFNQSIDSPEICAILLKLEYSLIDVRRAQTSVKELRELARL